MNSGGKNEKNIILMLLVGVLCGGCYPLFHESGDEVEGYGTIYEGVMARCVRITLP